jgi:hypothetical protein
MAGTNYPEIDRRWQVPVRRCLGLSSVVANHGITIDSILAKLTQRPAVGIADLATRCADVRALRTGRAPPASQRHE